MIQAGYRHRDPFEISLMDCGTIPQDVELLL